MTTFDPVILNILRLRRAYPQIIAQSIVGTQPMMRPIGSIFNVRSKYLEGKITMNKDLYKTFLRLNDRKKVCYGRDFIKAKYPMVKFTQDKNWHEVLAWCERQYGNSGYTWCGGDFFFKDEDDAMLFRLAGWAS